MRVFVLDPSLIDFVGHHNHFADGIRDTLRGWELETRIYGNRRASAALQKRLEVRPLFHYSGYEQISRDKYDGFLQGMSLGAARFADDLAGLGADGPGDDDLVIIPTAGARDLAGMSLWTRNSERRPRTVFLFHGTFRDGLDLSPGTLGAGVHRFAARMFDRDFGRDRVLLAATNERLARRLAPLLDRQLEVLPVPVWYGQAGSGDSSQAGPQEEPSLLLLGDMRPGRGFRRTPKLIRAISARRPGTRCVIHVGVARNVPDLSHYWALQEEGMAQVIQRWIEGDELHGLLARSSVVVLPYDRGDYSYKISGVFALAVAAGRPCVVPDGTWMAARIAAGQAAGLCYEGDDVDSMAEVLAGALDDRDVLMRRAGELAPAWRRTQSGPALVNRVLEWAHNECDY